MTFSIPSALFALTMAAADSGSADSVRAAVIDRLENGSVVRVTTASGERTGHVTLRSAGLDFGTPSFRGMESRHEPDLIAWSDMQKVEISRPGMSHGAAIGLVAGIVASVVWIHADPPESDAGFLKFGWTAQGKAVGRVLLGALFGSAIGAGVGYQMRDWEQVHP